MRLERMKTTCNHTDHNLEMVVYLVAFVFDQFFKSVDNVDETIFVHTSDVTYPQLNRS